MNVIRKLLTSAPSSLNDAARTVDFVISTAARDRDGDRIPLDAWRLDDFKRNPIVLFGHDAQRPIAQALNVRRDGDALVATVQFPPSGVSELADETFGLIRAGVLRAASVGFRPIAPPIQNEFGGRDYPDVTLLEFSIVTIPANTEALRRSVAPIVRRELGRPENQNPRLGPPTECPLTAAGNCPNDRQSLRCPAGRSCPIVGHSIASLGRGLAWHRRDLREVIDLDLDGEIAGLPAHEFKRAFAEATMLALKQTIDHHVRRCVNYHLGRVD
jgi:HK97 family phage prohead protease